jgi:hypothetical protein
VRLRILSCDSLTPNTELWNSVQTDFHGPPSVPGANPARKVARREANAVIVFPIG